jgi:hypothetical protein
LSLKTNKGRLLLEALPSEDKAAIVEAILNVPNDEHFDRVARINASLVLAQGEQLRGPDGYRNPKLLEGCNVVRSYLIRLALDHCVVMGNPE